MLDNAVLPRIVVVGGGAGGLELVTKLGKKLGKKNKAEIILVDRNTTHLWKPLLHEIAVGSMDEGIDAVSYRGHANTNGFYFRVGTMKDLDREKQEVVIAPIMDEEGREVLPETRIPYDYVVIALGSVSNDFNTPGIKDNCIFLDSPSQAYKFRNRLINRCLRIQRLEHEDKTVRIAIVGGGATGVELSAELHYAVHEIHNYGFNEVDNDHLKVTLVEAGPRILPALPERISNAALEELKKIGVDVKLSTMITSADAQGLHTKDGQVIQADLMVWAAGIKVPDFMKDLAGLETNRINQLVVNEFLQTADPRVFAIGDCAQFTNPDGSRVPPRAQSAHQMASICLKNIMALLDKKPLTTYVYKDNGSLVSLANYSTVGNLMGNLGKNNSLFIEGKIARMVYVSLYRMHQIAIHGPIKSWLVILAGKINRWVRPRLKLH